MNMTDVSMLLTQGCCLMMMMTDVKVNVTGVSMLLM